MRKIYLAIGGSHMSAAGFQTLYSVNTPPERMVVDGEKPHIDTSHYYEVATSEAGVKYTIIHRNVCAADSNRPGPLKLSIMIPKGYRIAGNVGPYEILREIDDIFWKENVNAIERRLKMEKAPDRIFTEVLDKYPLVPYYGTYRVMSGKGYALLCLDEQMMSLLFKDVHYREFEAFGEIVIASHGSAVNMLSGLQIPRKVQVPIMINGAVYRTITPEEFTKTITFDLLQALKLSSATHEETEVKFNVAEMLGGASYESVKFDEREECIFCTAVPKEKSRRVIVRTNPPMANSSMLCIICNGVQIPVVNGIIELRGLQMFNPTLSISVSHPSYRYISHDIDGDVLTIELKYEPRQIEQDPTAVVKILGLKGVNKNWRRFDIHFICGDDSRDDYDVDLRGTYERALPNGWNNKYVEVYGENQRYELYQNEGVYKLKPGENRIHLDVSKRSFFAIHKKLLTIIAACVVGIGVIVALCFLLLRDKKSGLWIWEEDVVKERLMIHKEELGKKDFAFSYLDEAEKFINDTLLMELPKTRVYSEHRQEMNEVIRITKEYRAIANFFSATFAQDDDIRNAIKKLAEDVKNGSQSQYGSCTEKMKKCLDNKDYLGLVLKGKAKVNGKVFAIDNIDDLDGIPNGTPNLSIFRFEKPTTPPRSTPTSPPTSPPTSTPNEVEEERLDRL